MKKKAQELQESASAKNYQLTELNEKNNRVTKMLAQANELNKKHVADLNALKIENDHLMNL